MEFLKFSKPGIIGDSPLAPCACFWTSACMNASSPSNDPIESINRRAYDAMAERDHFLTTPVTAAELSNPLATLDARGWLGGNIRGWRVLCLAGGGGRQGPLYAAAGAEVTIVDLSGAMLERDRALAKQLGIAIRLLQGSMSDLRMLASAEFDLVAHPVSTCYVANLAPVFGEIARVLRPGGLYISQHKQPANLQSSLRLHHGHYVLETEVGGPAKPVAIGDSSWLREPNTVEFAHSLDSLLGGICRAGMTIEDVSEPNHSKPEAAPESMSHRSRYLPPYLRIKARLAAETKPRSLILQ